MTLIGLGCASFAFMFGQRWLQQPMVSPNEAVLAAVAMAILSGAVALRGRWPWVAEAAASAGAAATMAAILMILADTAFSIVPQAIPAALTAQAPSLQRHINLLDYPEQAPWVKFRPNVAVELPDVRGDDFVGRWQTDDRGFKNLPEIAGRRQFAAIAAGDSFVEAMGVTIEDAWPSQLSRRGYPTYNVGVQGYAPVQALAALSHYTADLTASTFLFGYTPGYEARESQYVGRDPASRKVFTGGIGALHAMAEDRRTSLHYHFLPVTNSAIDIVRHTVGRLIVNAQYQRAETSRVLTTPAGPLEYYRREVLESATEAFDPHGPAQRLMVERLTEFQALAHQRGAIPAVVYFPSRPQVYWRPVTGTDLPEAHPIRRRQAWLRETCAGLGIDLIDPGPLLAESVSTETPSRLPFNRIDGHYSPLGNELVTQAVAAYLSQRR